MGRLMMMTLFVFHVNQVHHGHNFLLFTFSVNMRYSAHFVMPTTFVSCTFFNMSDLVDIFLSNRRRKLRNLIFYRSRIQLAYDIT